LLIDLGFSANGLDPLFDAGILREVFSDQAVLPNSELRTGLLEQMPWSKKRQFCGRVGELLNKRRDILDQSADFFCRAHRYADARECRARAAEEACHSGQYAKAFYLWKRVLEIWPLIKMLTSEAAPLKKWRDVPVTPVTLAPHDLPGKRYWRHARRPDQWKARLKRTINLQN
jgi:hypothetical protein